LACGVRIVIFHSTDIVFRHRMCTVAIGKCFSTNLLLKVLHKDRMSQFDEKNSNKIREKLQKVVVQYSSNESVKVALGGYDHDYEHNDLLLIIITITHVL